MTTSRDRRTVARRLLAAALGMLLSGCSFMSVQRPRSPAVTEDPRMPDTCTTSNQAAVADTVLAGVGLVAGYIWLLSEVVKGTDCIETSTSTCNSGNPAPGLGVMAAGGVFAGSAIYGWVSAAQCRHRVVAGSRCASGDIAACQRLKPGWVPPPGWRAGPTLEPRPVPMPPPAPPAPPAPGSQEWTQEPPPQPGAPPPPPPNPR